MFDSYLDPGSNAGVGVFFTDRTGGFSKGGMSSLNLGRTDLDDVAALRANMGAVRRASGLECIAVVHQMHGVEVHDVDQDPDWRGDRWLGDRIPGAARIPLADAMVASVARVGLAIRVADCLPVLLADPWARIVAAAHAGRRGLLDGVLRSTVEAMTAKGARRITAWIGPHICGSCYEVPGDMAADAQHRIPGVATTTSWGSPAIDLGTGACIQLAELGVEVHSVDPCTLTTPSLFSHRGDGPDAGRQVGVVWLD